MTLTNLNDIHPNTSNHGLTPCTGFDKTGRKTIFRSMSSSFSDSFVAKTAFLQCKTLRKEEKLAKVTFLNSKAWEMKYLSKL